MKNLKGKAWWDAAVTRCIRTIAQTVLGSGIATAAILSEINWRVILSTAVIAGLTSLLTSLSGLPEVDTDE